MINSFRFDSIQTEIEVANDAVFRAQGIANKGMQKWFEQKAEERRGALLKLQKGKRMVGGETTACVLVMCAPCWSCHARDIYVM